jgi:ABC-type nitrate/sulfonate/bicarbonate transport system substrate-binding protein
MKRVDRGRFAVLVISLMLFGLCVSDAYSAELFKIRYGGLNLGQWMSPGAEIALAKGFFKDEGLDVEAKYYRNGPECIQFLSSGEVDIGTGAPAVAMASAVQGVDLVILYIHIRGGSTLVARQGINTVKDLDGKKIGSPGAGTYHDSLVVNLEKQNNIKIDHVYSRIQDLFLFLEKGEIDAVVGWEPIASRAVRTMNAKYLVPVLDANASGGCVFTSRSFAEKNPDKLVKFIRATMRGLMFYRENKDYFFQLVSPTVGFDVVDIKAGVESGVFGKSVLDDPDIEFRSLKELTLQMRDSEKIPAKSMPDDAAYNRFAAKHINDVFLKLAKAELPGWVDWEDYYNIPKDKLKGMAK